MFDKRSEGNYNKQENNSSKHENKNGFWNLLHNALTGAGAVVDSGMDEKQKKLSSEKPLPQKKNSRKAIFPDSFLDYETETSIYDWGFIKPSYSKSDTCQLSVEFTEKADISIYTPYLANEHFAWDLPPTYINDRRYYYAQNQHDGHVPQGDMNTQSQDIERSIVLIITCILFYVFVMLIMCFV